MRRYVVDSSVIEVVAFDEETSVLQITFRTGRVYDYYDVPARVVEELLAAESQGRYFNTKIREKYRDFEVTPESTI